MYQTAFSGFCMNFTKDLPVGKVIVSMRIEEFSALLDPQESLIFVRTVTWIHRYILLFCYN